MATTPQHPAPRHPAPQHPAPKHPEPSPTKNDPSKNDPSNTKPPQQGGGDQSPHPSPATDPTNAAPEPAQFDDDNPRPPLPKGRDYVAGQPVTQAEYELTEKEAAERVRPEAWERLEGQGVHVQEGQKDASVGWDRSKEGTRPDGRPLRNPVQQDDDVNK